MHIKPVKMLIVFFSSFSLFLNSCSDSLGYLQKQMHNLGYIPYPTPLHLGGTGTLVGSDPRSLALIANPQTCFPDLLEGQATNLRSHDYSVLPNKKQTFNVTGSELIHFLESLQIGNPKFSADLNFQNTQSVEIEFRGVHVEYMDLIALESFYRQHMSSICKEYLDRVGFIIQAIKVDQMHFKFYDDNTNLIKLSVGQIEQILNNTTETKWQIKNETILVIDAPKYIGYQLGSLHQVGKGLSLYRANRVVNGRYAFASIDVFTDNYESSSNKAYMSKHEADPTQFYFDLESVSPLDLLLLYPLEVKTHKP